MPADLSIRRSAGMRRYPRVTAITLGCLPHRARNGHATSQIRSSMCGHPDPFGLVRDLGRVPARCSFQSREPEGRSSV